MLTVRLVFLLFLLALSAYFSGAETALFSLRSPQLARLRQRSTHSARAVLSLLQRPRSVLATVLIGNTLVNVVVSVVAAGLFVAWFGSDSGALLATLVMTLVLLVFGEIVPKTAAVGRPLGLARWIAPPLVPIQRMMRPWSGSAVALTDTLARALERHVPPRDEALTEKEIKTLVTMGWEQGVVGVREKEFIHNVFQLNDRRVENIVTSRTRVFALDVDSEVSEVRDAVALAGYSRVPVYETSSDNLVGYVVVNDLLWGRDEPDPRRLRDVRRDLHFYPGAMRVGQLLVDMRRRGEEIAGVVDEHGGLDGIVSLEDALEEVVGEIFDLHDAERTRYTPLAGGEVLVGAQMEIDIFNQILGTDLQDAEMETIGGFVMHRLGRIPEQGEILEVGNLRFHVEHALPNRILKLRVGRMQPAHERGRS